MSRNYVEVPYHELDEQWKQDLPISSIPVKCIFLNIGQEFSFPGCVIKTFATKIPQGNSYTLKVVIADRGTERKFYSTIDHRIAVIKCVILSGPVILVIDCGDLRGHLAFHYTQQSTSADCCQSFQPHPKWIEGKWMPLAPDFLSPSWSQTFRIFENNLTYDYYTEVNLTAQEVQHYANPPGLLYCWLFNPFVCCCAWPMYLAATGGVSYPIRPTSGLCYQYGMDDQTAVKAMRWGTEPIGIEAVFGNAPTPTLMKILTGGDAFTSNPLTPKNKK